MDQDKLTVTFTVNGRRHSLQVAPRKLASDMLREDLGLTGTHIGCEHGICGACTIRVDGRPVRSCLLFAVQLQGCAVETIESVAKNDRFSPLQQALHEEHGLQCGFCTPGLIMTFETWLDAHPDPSEGEIREALSGNLCRCTGYHNIVKAILKAARLRQEALS
ncbi:(2Fe-2S)-binding protein [Ferrovibrio xuzhouensis]|uniref:(2Fe-2S)-binding protein n=1 Tax=Ferrovibrio xuzhouensis TaxID=1576914 RepID=A0ABV7VLD3_9PROT